MKKLLKSEIYKSYEQYTDPLVCTVYTKKSTITTKKKNTQKMQTQLINAESKDHLSCLLTSR